MIKFITLFIFIFLLPIRYVVLYSAVTADTTLFLLEQERKYEKELFDLLRTHVKIRKETILNLLGIDPIDTDSVKSVTGQIENLERYGLVKDIGGKYHFKFKGIGKYIDSKESFDNAIENRIANTKRFTKIKESAVRKLPFSSIIEFGRRPKCAC